MRLDHDDDVPDEAPEGDGKTPRRIFSPTEFRVWLAVILFGALVFVAAPYIFRETRGAPVVSEPVPASDATPRARGSMPLPPPAAKAGDTATPGNARATKRPTASPPATPPAVTQPASPAAPAAPAPAGPTPAAQQPTSPAQQKKGPDTYWIQVAAMRDPDGARRLVAELSAHDFPVDRSGLPAMTDRAPAAMNEGEASSARRSSGLILVRVGAFSDRPSAVAALGRLKELGYKDIYITRAR
jgi:cell division septation protein DedD